MASVLCPFCGCEHQVFKGMGVLCPARDDNSGRTLTCCFPSTGVMVRIDLPDDVKIAGLTNYCRYHCECGDHSWALLTSYHVDQTVSWAVDLGDNSKKKKKSKKPDANNQVSYQITDAFKAFLDAISATGSSPTMVLGKGLAGSLPPEAVEALKEKGWKLLEPGALSGNPTSPESSDQPMSPTDHEHPLIRLVAEVKYAYKNWPHNGQKPITDKTRFALPRLPVRRADKGQPPHMAVGTNHSADVLHYMRDWLFSLAVELPPAILPAIHSMVYWDNLLIVVSQAVKDEKTALAKGITDQVVALNQQKPDVFLMTRQNYLVLLRDKADELAAKKKL